MYKLMNVHLDNGLKVVLHRIPSSKTIACGVWVKQGSKYEDDETSGLSHLLEHLLITSNNNDEFDLLDKVESSGIVYNATTYKEYTSYYFSGIQSHLELCINSLASLVTEYKTVSNEVFENEKKVVIREASSFYSSFNQIAERSSQALWGDSDVGKIIVGNLESIKNATQDRVKLLYDSSYTPENSTLVVVGNFEYDDVLTYIENAFSQWIDRSVSRKETYVNKDPGMYLNSQSGGDNAIVSVVFKLPEFSNTLRNSLEVISQILGGGGLKSRLAQEIRMKRGLAYIINSYESFYEDRGMMGFASVCSPDTVSQVVELMMLEFKKCKEFNFEDSEINSAKNKLITKRVLGLENITDHLKFLGKCATYNSTFSLEEEIRNIRKVNKSTISLALKELFQDSNIGMAVIGDVNVDELVEKVKIS